ncbi:hypothetical protein C4579_00095 [Candidatus Microgenomates bacterium]|nr:MAG: hypothetical protein C4579_00095 [Candidatus Microgenomates bacterium]
MKEQERIITSKHNNSVSRSLKAILSPWSSVPKSELPEIMEKASVSVTELARSAGVSSQQALRDIPSRIAINDQHFTVMRSSNNGRKPNLRVKKLIRESVKEPPIKGVRNGGQSLDEKVLKRKMAQAKVEREKLVFQAVEPFDAQVANIQRRARIHQHIRESWEKKADKSQVATDQIPIDETNENLKILKSLVKVSGEDIRQITQYALTNPRIHLFDFANMLGLPDQIQKELQENREILDLTTPFERMENVRKLKRIIDSTPILHALSKDRIHPLTSFEEGVPLFFGMGGGSRMPCQGLPLDVLKMVFTGEKLRRELGLSQCFVLGADVITYTNIGRSPGFTKEKVDQVIGTEITVLNKLFSRFGFSHWKAIRQSELDQHFSSQKISTWQQNIAQADSVAFVGGHHYAIEMSDIQLMVPNGIKLGWWIRPLTRNTGYIMDEQPFHARFALVMSFLNKPHATTLLYTHAGSRLLLGDDGLLQKEAPYITYTPARRLLLSPFEDVKRKLEWTENRGGGLTIPFVRNQMQAMVDLFEELVVRIPISGKSENEILANKLQFIVEQGVGNDSHISQMWQEAFPNAV